MIYQISFGPVGKFIESEIIYKLLDFLNNNNIENNSIDLCKIDVNYTILNFYFFSHLKLIFFDFELQHNRQVLAI